MSEGTTEEISEFQVGIKPRTGGLNPPVSYFYHCKNSLQANGGLTGSNLYSRCPATTVGSIM